MPNIATFAITDDPNHEQREVDCESLLLYVATPVNLGFARVADYTRAPRSKRQYINLYGGILV